MTRPTYRRIFALALATWTVTSAGAVAQPSSTPPAQATGQDGAQAAPPAQPTQVFSGLMFGDYYYIAQNHRESIEQRQGFWMRRVYFTFDHNFSKAVTARVRLEMNSPGDFTSKTNLTPYVKDAYIRVGWGRQVVTLGIQPTPIFETADALWGYRHVEKTTGDLHAFESTRDFGVALSGPITRGGRATYTVQFGNGSGVGGEADQGKSVRGAVVYRAPSGYLVEGYADYQEKPGETNYVTWKALAGRQTATYRVGAEFYQQGRRNAAGTATDYLELLSVFGTMKVRDLWLFARVDRMFDPDLNGEKIAYVPFSDDARSTYLLAGVDITLQDVLHVVPNVSYIRYDEPEQGTRPDSDAQARLTFYFKW